MKQMWILAMVMAGSVVMAQTELAVNAVSGLLTNAGDVTSTTVTVTGAQAFGEKMTSVLEAELTFTQPTEMPEIDTADKLVLAASPEMKLLVSDFSGAAPAWKTLDVALVAGTPVRVRAEIVGTQCTVTAAGKSVTVTVRDADAPQQIVLDGVGATDKLALKQVSTAILPAGADAQDAGLVDKYAVWVTAQGNTFMQATDAEKQDAFAMNMLEGTPDLAITAIDPVTRTITITGSNDLANINGILYVTTAETLQGTAVTTAEDITISGGVATFTLPETAKFVRARVALVKPESL